MKLLNMSYAHKLKNIDRLKRTIRKLKKQNKRIVFTNGCFDLLHPGHIKVFTFAKKKGDVLVVGLNSNSSIKKIKGPKRPIQNQKSRAQILEAIDVIDYIVLFSSPTPLSLIKELKPDILVKGSDWGKGKIVGSDIVERVFRVSLLGRHSTTEIIKKIKKSA